MLSVDIRKTFRSTPSSRFELRIQEVFPPGFTVLFGPSGAGKSTLLDCVAGLALPDEGMIRLGDEAFYDAKNKIALPPQKRGVGYVFQSLALFPHLTVEENVHYGIAKEDAAEQQRRTESILRAFHIDALAKRKPRELSGGEQQRVALARSLVTEPRVLLLDEPLTGLDSGLRQSILQDLRDWNAAHRVPILYVTHNRDEVDAVGERVVAIVAGHVTERGTPDAVLDAPRSAALAHAAGFENLFNARVVEQRPADGVMRVVLAGDRCELEVPLGRAEVGAEIQVAIRAGDILLARECPVGLSARNIIEGKLEYVEMRGALQILRLTAGVPFEVHVTPGAVRALDLRAGIPVWLVIKTHSCRVLTRR
jgi:molybdate transport system ATP-binding protein